MAKARLNSALKAVQGNIDGLVYKKFKNGLVILSRKPKFEGHTWSKRQKHDRGRFGQASLYARQAWVDPAARAFYEKVARARGAWRAYSVATGDFLNAPRIEEIDLAGYAGRAGDRVRVRASDDVGVVQVEVTLRNARGQVLESGKAAPGRKESWTYAVSTTQVRGTKIEIEVAALDRPGNRVVEVRSVAVT